MQLFAGISACGANRAILFSIELAPFLEDEAEDEFFGRGVVNLFVVFHPYLALFATQVAATPFKFSA